MTEQIRRVHADSRGTYGGQRVHAELTLGLSIAVGHGAVEMLMRRAGLRGLPGSRRRRPVHQTPTAADLVDRQFARTEPDRLWVTDIERHEALTNRAVVKGHRPWPVAAGRVKQRAA
ncbi:IS3 family transposase [Actinomadura viridis]|uniref:IS3 family transposase n=1 Tax=Actinomadura viridis TaxID=58110 RepID=UPI001E360BA7|nr:IS3 family transposase [Actinomadura viridis]